MLKTLKVLYLLVSTGQQSLHKPTAMNNMVIRMLCVFLPRCLTWYWMVRLLWSMDSTYLPESDEALLTMKLFRSVSVTVSCSMELKQSVLPENCSLSSLRWMTVFVGLTWTMYLCCVFLCVVASFMQSCLWHWLLAFAANYAAFTFSADNSTPVARHINGASLNYMYNFTADGSKKPLHCCSKSPILDGTSALGERLVLAF